MEKRVQDYGKEILNVVRSNVSPAVLAKRLQDFHENDLADVLEELSVVEALSCTGYGYAVRYF